jgi:hypothetical protein
MTPPDLKTTRTYYWTWQGCSLAFALAVGGAAYLLCKLAGPVGFPEGIIVGIVMAGAWHRTKWRDGQ